jgi:hypothetical protein
MATVRSPFSPSRFGSSPTAVLLRDFLIDFLASLTLTRIQGIPCTTQMAAVRSPSLFLVSEPQGRIPYARHDYLNLNPTPISPHKSFRCNTGSVDVLVLGRVVRSRSRRPRSLCHPERSVPTLFARKSCRVDFRVGTRSRRISLQLVHKQRDDNKATINSKRLTEKLSPLSATLTKNRGGR